jgi:hypothetical protein
MKKMCIALKVQNGNLEIGKVKVQLEFPDGCIGVCLVFESKKKAKEYYGNNINLAEVEYDESKRY